MDLRILFVDIWTLTISHLLSLLLLSLCILCCLVLCVDIPSCMYVSWLVFLCGGCAVRSPRFVSFTLTRDFEDSGCIVLSINCIFLLL
jgi:hypothetical protein